MKLSNLDLTAELPHLITLDYFVNREKNENKEEKKGKGSQIRRFLFKFRWNFGDESLHDTLQNLKEAIEKNEKWKGKTEKNRDTNKWGETSSRQHGSPLFVLCLPPSQARSIFFFYSRKHPFYISLLLTFLLSLLLLFPHPLPPAPKILEFCKLWYK